MAYFLDAFDAKEDELKFRPLTHNGDDLTLGHRYKKKSGIHIVYILLPFTNAESFKVFEHPSGRVFYFFGGWVT